MKAGVIEHVVTRELSSVEAVEVLCLSGPQIKRPLVRVRRDGEGIDSRELWALVQSWPFAS